MDYHSGALPFTGAGILVAGYTIGEMWMVAAAVAVMIVGALLMRIARPAK